MSLSKWLAGLFIFILIPAIVQAQSNCDINTDSVVESVEDVCSQIGENQVCYGNFNVNVVPRVPETELSFDQPGDSTNLADLRSLYLSSLSPEENTWGIAQLRLLVSSPTGLQDITMLLFGDVSIENTVEEGIKFGVTVRTRAADLYEDPSVTSLILANYVNGDFLQAVARLEDSSWIRVEDSAKSLIGWVSADLLRPVDSTHQFEELQVQAADSQYYAPMQAFYFSNGTSTDCPDVAADGLLIQTPEGVARVSLLINEVSIELTSPETGSGATAFIQADPEETEAMSVNVLGGAATVQTSAGTQTVEAGMQTNIPITLDLIPDGAPTNPEPYNPENLHVENYLPVLQNLASQPVVPVNTSNSTLGVGTGNGSSGSNGSGSSEGVNITTNSTGSGNGTSSQGTGSTSSGSSSGQSATGSGSGQSSGTSSGSSGLPLGSGSGGSTSTAQQSETQLSTYNIIAVVLLMVAGGLFLGGIIFATYHYGKQDEE